MGLFNSYRDHNFNAREIRNVSLEKLATDPTGAGLYAGRVWENTTDARIKWYDGTAVKTLAQLEDLEAFGALVGTHDATTGIPTTGSGPSNAIRQGDYWIVSVGGTIAGLSGASTTLQAGDFIFAGVDAAAASTDFYGVQTNISVPASIASVEEVTLANLPANTPTAIPTTLTNVYGIQAFDSTDAEIGLCIAGATTAPTAESTTALTNVKFRIVGTV